MVSERQFSGMHDGAHDKNQRLPEVEAMPGPSIQNMMIVANGTGSSLSPAQVEFNKLMKRLESARTKHQREEAALDRWLATCIRDLMPLVDEIHRADFQLVVHGQIALESFKLTARRREWFADLLSGKAEDLLADSSGLSHEDVARLDEIVAKLGPSRSGQQAEDDKAEGFDFFREMLEGAARKAGVEIDLEDLDIRDDPAEFERKLLERMEATAAALGEKDASAKGGRRKPTKAQMEKERRQREIEEAKQRDLKSLYKQLAKALHPDLETDPVLKIHKESWMKRLTSAYGANDLRELLKIEMEWLGEEASNLATAGDDKLRVYCMVLKEQIAELRDRTEGLRYEPQYVPLRRFMDDFTGFMPDPEAIRAGLDDEAARHHGMIEMLKAGDKAACAMVNRWADEHARYSQPRGILF